jgi:hypothetical protein
MAKQTEETSNCVLVQVDVPRLALWLGGWLVGWLVDDNFCIQLNWLWRESLGYFIYILLRHTFLLYNAFWDFRMLILKEKCLIDERPRLFKLLVFLWRLLMKLTQFAFYVYNSSGKWVKITDVYKNMRFIYFNISLILSSLFTAI